MHSFQSAPEFEVHLTVAPLAPGDGKKATATQLTSLRSFCHSRDWRLLEIVLARGEVPHQPMVTYSARGALALQIEQARQVESALNLLAWRVVRCKIEVDPELLAGIDGGVGNGLYFEQHIKLSLASPQDFEAARTLSVEYGAHLSRNAHTPGYFFVTQRGTGSMADARDAFAPLAEALRKRFACSPPVLEYVAYDSNLSLDDGWLTPA